ncbi:DUF1707 SHOCT-like domain-containing protein [Amycolatopsis saalfeldensis]|uniref:DUF1707 domain-containing protein n=1 Tax=Amycolatopsis saalfeldensis TaxID=394193 RepID=A0A1H8SD00_9PSEU|nr:DUF1707 domain-containing protein [Amycolatopsis saalfeldensis]SEO76063.1 protein of unknown function [Amycolatopsis saalfeldensis]
MTSDDPVPSGVRCSDAERERTAAALHQAVGEGRLSLAEVEERTTAIYAAQYRHELDAVVADLPAAEAAAAPGWRPLLTGLGQQVTADLMSLTAARRKAMLIALVVLAVVAALMLAVHGITDEGHGPHSFGHD